MCVHVPPHHDLRLRNGLDQLAHARDNSGWQVFTLRPYAADNSCQGDTNQDQRGQDALPQLLWRSNNHADAFCEPCESGSCRLKEAPFSQPIQSIRPRLWQAQARQIQCSSNFLKTQRKGLKGLRGKGCLAIVADDVSVGAGRL
jgi:hypothetical protein